MPVKNSTKFYISHTVIVLLLILLLCTDSVQFNYNIKV
jgi:hypothetical protein